MSLPFSSHLSSSPFQKNELLWAVTWHWPRIHFCGSSVSNCHLWQEPFHTITTWMDLDLSAFIFSPPLHKHTKKNSAIAGTESEVTAECLQQMIFSSFSWVFLSCRVLSSHSHRNGGMKRCDGRWRVKSRDQYWINRLNSNICNITWGVKTSRAQWLKSCNERIKKVSQQDKSAATSSQGFQRNSSKKSKINK